jgi:Cytochrome P450
MGYWELLHDYPRAAVAGGIFVALLLYAVGLAVFHLYFSPLSRFPGPKLAAVSIVPKLWQQAGGQSVRWIASLHRKYGPIVRVGPTELSFIDAQAWQDIYGFQPPGKPASRKDPRFYDFASLETRSVINTSDADHSRTRRVFSHAFSDRALKEQEPLLVKYIDLLGEKLQEIADADPDEKIDMVKMLNFTTFDIMGRLWPSSIATGEG